MASSSESTASTATHKGVLAQIGNPKALGFGAFAILLWLYAMILVGWFPEATSTETAQDASFIASASLLIAALASFLRGESWHAIFFAFWSTYAWRLGPQGGEAGPEAFRAWFYLVIGAFHLFLSVGAYRNQKLAPLRPLLAFGLTLAYLSASLASFGLADIFFVIDGYLGLLIALLAFWIAGAELGALPKVAWPEREESFAAG